MDKIELIKKTEDLEKFGVIIQEKIVPLSNIVFHPLHNLIHVDYDWAENHNLDEGRGHDEVIVLDQYDYMLTGTYRYLKLMKEQVKDDNVIKVWSKKDKIDIRILTQSLFFQERLQSEKLMSALNYMVNICHKISPEYVESCIGDIVEIFQLEKESQYKPGKVLESGIAVFERMIFFYEHENSSWTETCDRFQDQILDQIEVNSVVVVEDIKEMYFFLFNFLKYYDLDVKNETNKLAETISENSIINRDYEFVSKTFKMLIDELNRGVKKTAS